MWMRTSMVAEDWFQNCAEEFNSGLETAMGGALTSPGGRSVSRLQITRALEYPWALHAAPPQGNILDVGSESQFHCALLGLGHRVTSHHSPLDTPTLGRMFGWEADYHGGISLEQCYMKYREKFTLVMGFLDQLQFIRDEVFDTIYCISVIEHVFQEELDPLMQGMWRLLAPGGKMCITCDFWPSWNMNDGINEKVNNWDLMPFVKELGVEPGPLTSEIPGHEDYDPSTVHDKDVLHEDWYYPLTVYGFVIQKPAQ